MFPFLSFYIYCNRSHVTIFMKISNLPGLHFEEIGSIASNSFITMNQKNKKHTFFLHVTYPFFIRKIPWNKLFLYPQDFYFCRIQCSSYPFNIKWPLSPPPLVKWHKISLNFSSLNSSHEQRNSYNPASIIRIPIYSIQYYDNNIFKSIFCLKIY
jgi:hypothetical protein